MKSLLLSVCDLFIRWFSSLATSSGPSLPLFRSARVDTFAYPITFPFRESGARGSFLNIFSHGAHASPSGTFLFSRHPGIKEEIVFFLPRQPIRIQKEQIRSLFDLPFSYEAVRKRSRPRRRTLSYTEWVSLPEDKTPASDGRRLPHLYWKFLTERWIRISRIQIFVTMPPKSHGFPYYSPLK